MEGKQKCDLIHGVGRPTFPKCFWPMWFRLNDQSEYNCLTIMCGLGTQSPAPQSRRVPSDETRVPTNRRFLFSQPGMNRKVSWDCGLRTLALPLMSSVPSLGTESLQHHALPAVSGQEKLCCGMRFCGLQTTPRSAN